MATPHFYINPPFSGLSSLSKKKFRTLPCDSIFGRFYPPHFNKGGGGGGGGGGGSGGGGGGGGGGSNYVCMKESVMVLIYIL